MSLGLTTQKKKRLEEKVEEGKNEKDKYLGGEQDDLFVQLVFTVLFSSPLFFAELEEDGLWPTK